MDRKLKGAFLALALAGAVLSGCGGGDSGGASGEKTEGVGAPVQGKTGGKLTVLWSASDKNLGRQPITLSYSELAEGPWTPIAANLENNGRYVWPMPLNLPHQFVHIRARSQRKHAESSRHRLHHRQALPAN